MFDHLRTSAALLPFAAVLVLPPAASPRAVAAQPYSVVDADHFDAKLNAILQRAAARTSAPLRTIVTENEVNAYLVHRARPQMSAGVADPRVRILGGGRITCQATLDLDAVRDARPRSWYDPMRLLTGRMPVVATGVLHARGGLGLIDVESASVSGMPVPRAVVKELVSYYSKSPSYPDGFPLDSAFALPAGIRDIELGAGQAVIVQ